MAMYYYASKLCGSRGSCSSSSSCSGSNGSLCNEEGAGPSGGSCGGPSGSSARDAPDKKCCCACHGHAHNCCHEMSQSKQQKTTVSVHYQEDVLQQCGQHKCATREKGKGIKNKTAAASQTKNSANIHGSAGASYANGGQSESSHSDSGSALVYTDGVLVSGSLEALVLHMVPTADYYPDRAFLFAFLLSSRLFIRPHELLGEVCALAEAQQRLAEMQGLPKDRCQRYVQHLVQLLREWTESFPYDFRDEAVMAHVRDLTQRLVAGTAAGCGAGADPAIRKEVSALLQELLHRLTTLENYEALLARYGAGAAPGTTQAIDGAGAANSVDNLTVADVTELAASPLALARQLTHIELERLSYIGPEEFVQAFAKEHPGVDPNCKEAKKTRNLELYVAWFNRLSYLVATEVCKHPKKKHRVRVMEFWIEAARECFNIGNFNSLMAIIAGLNMAPVSRLKKTWNKVQSAKFSILEHQMDPTCNFSSYRSTLKAAVWRSAGSGSGGGGGGSNGGCTQPAAAAERIVVPFFSLLVKDLYFLNEGCSNRLPNGHINFEKFWQVAKQVTEFMAWKQVECPFEKNSNVILFLQASPVLSESALALASFDCEAPDGAHEKEHYKTLKAELNAANNS